MKPAKDDKMFKSFRMSQVSKANMSVPRTITISKKDKSTTGNVGGFGGNIMNVLPQSMLFSPPVQSNSKAMGGLTVLQKAPIMLPGKVSKGRRVVRISKKNIKSTAPS